MLVAAIAAHSRAFSPIARRAKRGAALRNSSHLCYERGHEALQTNGLCPRLHTTLSHAMLIACIAAKLALRTTGNLMR